MSRLIVTNVETQNIKFDSDTTAFTIGSDGVLSLNQVLSGTGSPSMVKLSKTTVSSAVSLVAFDNSIITSAYDNYYITIQNAVTASNNADLRAQCSINNGSSFVTHECSLSYFRMNGTDTGRYHTRTSIMITEDEDHNAARGINGDVTLYGVNGSTTKDALSHGFCTNYGTTTAQYAYQGYTALDTASVVNYIKIFANSNIASGIFTIYGIK
jgi:hypothetical protein